MLIIYPILLLLISVCIYVGIMAFKRFYRTQDKYKRNLAHYIKSLEHVDLLIKENSRLSKENRIYYSGVYQALKYLEPHQSEEVIKILMNSKTFKKAYDIERNKYVNEKNIHIDRDVYKSTMDTILNNLN